MDETGMIKTSNDTGFRLSEQGNLCVVIEGIKIENVRSSKSLRHQAKLKSDRGKKNLKKYKLGETSKLIALSKLKETAKTKAVKFSCFDGNTIVRFNEIEINTMDNIPKRRSAIINAILRASKIIMK